MSNLEIHAICLGIGFIISIGWWNDEKPNPRYPWQAVSIATFWILLSAVIVVSVNERPTSYVEALFLGIDYDYFFSDRSMIKRRGAGILITVSIVTFTFFFRWLWHFKNHLKEQKKKKHIKAVDTTATSRRVSP
ncbi:hypothetical protein VDG1235_1883 [Verrucomicrobiia bacterium DG1235]|nr:hypothetical protein VDG1235_1883 [Verrucomicrobiae bacterium DG1235]